MGAGKAAGSGLSARPPPHRLAAPLTVGPLLHRRAGVSASSASSQGHSGGDHINCPTPIPSPFLWDRDHRAPPSLKALCRPVLAPSDSGVRTSSTAASVSNLSPSPQYPARPSQRLMLGLAPQSISHPRGRPALFLTRRCSRPTYSLTGGESCLHTVPAGRPQNAIFNTKP